MDLTGILTELSLHKAVSGQEMDMAVYIKSQFEKYCDHVEIDKFSNVIGIKKGYGQQPKKIMITAHYDEIGFMVKSIDKRGFIKFTGVGGIDGKILLGQEVVIHGKKEIIGVIGAKPPHLLKPDEVKKAVKLSDLAIDIGMNYEKAAQYISIGDVITFSVVPVVLSGGKLSGKSMDNRSSVAALLEIMQRLSAVKHISDIYFIATVQEETGATGAAVASYNINPDMAVVIDACHGDMPDTPKDETYGLGKGPAIGVGPILNKKMYKKAVEISRDENIPYQIDIETGSTGTEAWETQVSRSGIPTMLVSIPVRYMHTAIETVNVDDIKNTGRLAAAFIVKAEQEMEEILCY